MQYLYFVLCPGVSMILLYYLAVLAFCLLLLHHPDLLSAGIVLAMCCYHC